MSASLRPAIAVLLSAVVGVVGAGGCSGSPRGPTISGKVNPDRAPAVSPVVSSDILAREPVANTATVKHILISWSDLAEAFGGRLDPRAAKRSKADAEAEVRSLVKQLQ